MEGQFDLPHCTTPSHACDALNRTLQVDISRSSIAAPRSDRGGAGTSIENNNVFTVQPNVYFEGMDPSKEQASVYQMGASATGLSNTAIGFVQVLAFGSLAVAGVAAFIYISQTQ